MPNIRQSSTRKTVQNITTRILEKRQYYKKFTKHPVAAARKNDAKKIAQNSTSQMQVQQCKENTARHHMPNGRKKTIPEKQYKTSHMEY